MSYDLCEYHNSHPGMRRQSQALRLVIKQATNAKPVSQANKPQRSLSRRTLRNSDVASKSKDFFLNMRVAVLDTTRILLVAYIRHSMRRSLTNICANCYSRLTLARSRRRAFSFGGVDGGNGQFDGKGRAFSLALALRRHAAAVHLDQLSRQRESQSETADASAARRPGLLIAIEHVRQKFRFDALSRVTDGDLDVVVYAFQNDLDAAALVRELDGVREQVPHHLLQTIRVAGDLPDASVEAGVERDAFDFRSRTHDLLRLLDHIRHVCRTDFQLQLAADGARGV